MISRPLITEEIELGMRARGLDEQEIAARTARVLEVCGLRPFRSWPVSALSHGQKKRVRRWRSWKGLGLLGGGGAGRAPGQSAWGLLVGWTQLRADNWDVLLAMYAGSAFWVIGYDTIYAMQDREDDALVGIRSSALRLGGRVQGGVALFYAGAVALWALAFWLYRADWLALLALLPAAGHLAWQVATLDGEDPDNPLDRFRANRWTGALVAAACFVVGNA